MFVAFSEMHLDLERPLCVCAGSALGRGGLGTFVDGKSVTVEFQTLHRWRF